MVNSFINTVNLYLFIYLYIIYFFLFHILEEIERREKALIEELNLIEMQIGLGKNSQNFEASTSLHIVEASRSIEEGEENRDPNPEHIEAAIIDNADVSMQSIINENFNDNDMEKKEEVQLNQVQPDETNG